MNQRLVNPSFPRSSLYHPDWLLAGVSGGANPLWVTEWLSTGLNLQPGMRVLDLGCGRAVSSIFLHREFGVQVWATDLWFSPSENLQRIRDAGAEDSVFPVHADARSLPFAVEFFDAIVCIDCANYFATDDLFLPYVGRFVKPGGLIAMAGAGLVTELGDQVPEHLQAWWEPANWSLHSADWWRRHWQRGGILKIELADTMPDGWQRWLDWLHIVAPENQLELQTIEADAGRTIGYVRVVGRRQKDAILYEPIDSLPPHYNRHPLLRETT